MEQTKMDNYIELLTDCLISAKPLLEASGREQIKTKLSDPAKAADLVLSSVDDVLQKLTQKD